MLNCAMPDWLATVRRPVHKLAIAWLEHINLWKDQLEAFKEQTQRQLPSWFSPDPSRSSLVPLSISG
jgi:hypothetical protein